MDDPVAEISDVIHSLCQARPNLQRETILKYFTPDASFAHPFCRTPESRNSRWYIVQIYQWYKVLSPRIDVKIQSVAFDEANKVLYVSIFQVFKIQLVPGYRAPVSLTTVLTLTNNSGREKAKVKQEKRPPKWYIKSQNDLYQTNEFIKFVVPFGIGCTLILFWQLLATYACVAGALLGLPYTIYRDRHISKDMDGIEPTDEAPLIGSTASSATSISNTLLRDTTSVMDDEDSKEPSTSKNHKP